MLHLRGEDSDSAGTTSTLHTSVSAACYTCGTLLELLIFLFPPLPRLEDAPQAGQLAVPADGWSVDPRHQATRSQHPLLVHKLHCSYCQSQKRGCVWFSLRYSNTLRQTGHTHDSRPTFI